MNMPWYGWIAIVGAGCVAGRDLCQRRPRHWALIAALLAAAAGDFFLANHHGRQLWYLAGISSFAVTHVFYSIHAWLRGTILWKRVPCYALPLLLLIGIWPWGPALATVPLPIFIGGAAYLVIFCMSFGINAARRPPSIAGWLGLAAVSLLILSDIMLVAEHFLKCEWSFHLCIPIYASSLVCAAISGLVPEKDGTHSSATPK